MSRNKKLETSEIIKLLQKASSVTEVRLKLNLSDKFLRRLFQKEGLLSPSAYLPYTNIDLTKNQKKRIISMYSDFGGGHSVNDIAAELRVPKEKVKEYIASEEITHHDLPLTKEEKKGPDEEKIKKAMEVHNYKLKAKIESLENDKIKQDALKWQHWKEIVGDRLFAFLKDAVGNYPVPKFDLETKRDYAAILAIQDFHFGRWSSSLEVKDATNVTKQQSDLFKCVTDLLEKVSLFGLPEVLYMTVGGDFCNSDNFKLTTTQGTEQDSMPSHTFMMFNGGILLIQLIDMLRQIFPKIELVITPGNHDRDSSVSLYMFVSAWFKDVSEVQSIYTDLSKPSDLEKVDLRPRQYRVYGENLLAFAHGDGLPIKNVAAVIANEAREAWGKTKYTIFMNGHFHNRISQDLSGVQHIQVPSIAGDDRYHALKAYQGHRGMSMVLVDKHKGYMAELFSPVD